jgi:hypothetical protein
MVIGMVGHQKFDDGTSKTSDLSLCFRSAR